MDKEEYLKDRVAEERRYFSSAAKKNKKRYTAVSIIRLLVSLLITVLSPVLGDFSVNSIVISVLGAIITFLDGLMFLKKYNECWVNYRITNEKLKEEEYYFKTKSEKYFHLDEEEQLDVFVQNIESIIKSTNQNWKKINLKKESR